MHSLSTVWKLFQAYNLTTTGHCRGKKMFRLLRSATLLPAMCMAAACTSATSFSGRADQPFSAGIVQQPFALEAGYPCATWVDGVIGGKVDTSGCGDSYDCIRWSWDDDTSAPEPIDICANEET